MVVILYHSCKVKYALAILSRSVATNPNYSAGLLEIDFDVDMDFGMYYSRPTYKWQKWGLREAFEAVGSSISGGNGIVPLAYKEFGRIASFWKQIGSNRGASVVHCAWHYMPAAERDLQAMRRLAEYCLANIKAM